MLKLLDTADQLFFRFVTTASLPVHLAVFFCMGAVVGGFLARCIARLPREESLRAPALCRACGGPIPFVDRIPLVGYLWRRGRCGVCGLPTGSSGFLTELATGVLFAAVIAAVIHVRSQEIPEGGHIDWIHLRIVYHLVLLSLLVAATGIDLEHYIIPDQITVTGMIIGLAGATWFANFQLVPLWVDWSGELPGLSGPYVPEWIKQHHHWHGLAWSAAGLIVGGGITWLVRILAGLVLGQESLGFGDVTLMAMIGSFIGWQAVVFVFLLAPLSGLVIGLSLRLCSPRTAVPYGPYLSAAAITVLLGWKWLWTPWRIIFGHWQTLFLLFAGTMAGLVLLLGTLRLYRRIPVTSKHRP